MAFPRATIAILTLLLLPAASAAQDPEIFFGNLHSHTSYSDGSSIPEVAYSHARDVADIDFLALTEHSHDGACGSDNVCIGKDPTLYAGTTSLSLKSTADRFTETGRFVALYGQEWSSISRGNHVNVFEVDEVIDVENGRFGELLDVWLPAHLDTSGEQALLLMNHPATSSSPDNLEYGMDDFGSAGEWREKLDARAQLINIINGPSHTAGTGHRPGRPSESEYLRYLNLGFHLAPTADQDNHFENWGDATGARTAVLATELSKPAILEALRNRHVYATEDKNLRIVARVNGHLIGSRVSGADCGGSAGNLDIRLKITDDDEPSAFYKVEAFSDEIGGDEAEPVVQPVIEQGPGEISISGVKCSGGEQYVFFRITQSHDDVAGEDRAWTAPIWFESGGAMPPPGGISAVTLVVDLFAEEAVVTHNGEDGEIDLSNWRLVSTRGNQEFIFPDGTKLLPGQSVKVTSGPSSQNNPPAVLRWSTDHLWNNGGDPGELHDDAGHLVAQTGEN